MDLSQRTLQTNEKLKLVFEILAKNKKNFK